MEKLLNLFSHRSMGTKLAVMTAAGVVSMVLVALTVLLIAREQLLVERMDKAHAVVDAVWQMAESYQRAAEKGELTPEEAKQRFFSAAGNIWYENHTNYVIVHDYETGINVVNAGIPELIGKDMRQLRDPNGLPFGSIMMDIAKNKGEGSLRFVFLRNSGSQPQDKIAYVRGFAPWHLMIAAPPNSWLTWMHRSGRCSKLRRW